MSYNPTSAAFLRRSNATTTHGASSNVALDLGESVVGSTRFPSNVLDAVGGREMYVVCDVVYTGNAGVNSIQFQSEFSGSSGDDDTGRQCSTASTSTVVARDEFFARGTSLTPRGIGLSLTNCTVTAGDCVAGGVIHS